MAGSVVCKGQIPARQLVDFQRNYWRPPVLRLGPTDSVRVMRPDRMVCLVTDVAKMEPMPVKRMYNGDRMAVRPGEIWKGEGQ